MKKTPFLPFASRTLLGLLALLPVLSLLYYPPVACAAEVDTGNALAAADTNGGYSGQVLAKVSRLWAPPPDTINRRVSLRLRIDGDGKLLQCDFTTASDMAAMNKAACEAAREAGNFGVPPYGMPTEVYMTFWTGRPRKEAKETTVNPAPKSIPVAAPTPTQAPAPAKAQTQAPASAPGKAPAAAKPAVQPPAPSKPLAVPKSDTVKAPQAPQTTGATKTAPTAKPSPTPAKPNRGGLSGEPDAATTPIKSSAPTAPPPKPASVKPDAAKTEDSKGKGAVMKQQPVKQEKLESVERPEKADKTDKTDRADKKAKAETPPAASKPTGIRTQFAPYRDPKAKPVLEQQAKSSASQQHYVQAITTHFQMRLIPPDKLKPGKYTVGVKLSVDGGGEVSEAELGRSSGQPALDETVLRLLLRAEKVLPPPDKQPQNLNFTLTVHQP